jgi:hypothetical protein
VGVGLGHVQHHIGGEKSRHRNRVEAADRSLSPFLHRGDQRGEQCAIRAGHAPFISVISFFLERPFQGDGKLPTPGSEVDMNWKTTKFDEVSMNKIWSEHVRRPARPSRQAHLVRTSSRNRQQRALSQRRRLASVGHKGDELRSKIAQDQIHAESVPVNHYEQRPWLPRCAAPHLAPAPATRPAHLGQTRPAEPPASHTLLLAAAAFVTDKVGYRVGLDPVDLGDDEDVKQVVQQIVNVNRIPQEK